MTTTLVAPRGALPRVRAGAPLAHPAPPRRAQHLRLVEAPTRVTRHRRRVVFAAILSVLTVLTVVAFHVELAQGQIALDQLGGRVTAAQRAYERARLEHAQLSAPARIVARAGELGLVSPTRPPTVINAPGDAAAASPQQSTPLANYGTVKPSLADSR